MLLCKTRFESCVPAPGPFCLADLRIQEEIRPTLKKAGQKTECRARDECFSLIHHARHCGLTHCFPGCKNPRESAKLAASDIPFAIICHL